MSETKENGESERVLPEPSEDQRVEEVVVQEELLSLVRNPVAEQSSELHVDTNPANSYVLVEAPVEPQRVEQAPKDADLPLDLKNGSKYAPVNQLDTVSDQNQNENQNASVDDKPVNESEPGNVQSQDNASGVAVMEVKVDNSESEKPMEATLKKEEMTVEEFPAHVEGSNQSFTFEPNFLDGDDSGTEEEQAAFMKVLENFHREKSLDFKPPKFYGEGLNCLKLWRQVTRLGGYDQVTSCKLWRQVGESFRPPKTCTTVSWSFRIFYEKALLEYEKHKIRTGELQVPISSFSEPMSADHEGGGSQALGSGRARRDAAARAMQGWHSQRLLGNGEVGEPIIKEKSSVSFQKRDKHLKSIGVLKRKKASGLDRAVKVARTKSVSTHMDVMVVDVGAPADWVKINVRRTKDCFEVYALVPGLLREEVHVQSDPAGRLVISGEPEQPDNPWGVTPFKKVITLPSRIDPHQTSAVVTLHGQLFVRAPFEQSDL